MLFNIDSAPKYTPLFLNYTKMEGDFELLEASNLNPIFFDDQRNVIDLETGSKLDSQNLKKGYELFDIIFSKETFEKKFKPTLIFSPEMNYNEWMKLIPCTGLYAINMYNHLYLVYYKSKNKTVYNYDEKLKIWFPSKLYFRFKVKLILENK